MRLINDNYYEICAYLIMLISPLEAIGTNTLQPWACLTRCAISFVANPIIDN